MKGILRLTRESLRQGANELRRRDPRLGSWIQRIGEVELRRHRHHFGALCRSIISQQLGAQAARAIHRRFVDLFFPMIKPDPARLLQMEPASLRACGLSERKAQYLRSLAGEFHAGSLARAGLGTLEDEQVIARLTLLPGVGRWTAEMFLIFSLGRLDVFSVGDLALRNAVERVVGRELKPRAIEKIAGGWSPYRSVASLYLWQVAHWPQDPSPQGSLRE